MAKPATQYKFDHEQLARMMLEDQEIHDGLWMLTIDFTMIGANVGPNPEAVLPSAVIGIQSVGLKKADEPAPLVFDAAILNPSR